MLTLGQPDSLSQEFKIWIEMYGDTSWIIQSTIDGSLWITTFGFFYQLGRWLDTIESSSDLM